MKKCSLILPVAMIGKKMMKNNTSPKNKCFELDFCLEGPTSVDCWEEHKLALTNTCH